MVILQTDSSGWQAPFLGMNTNPQEIQGLLSLGFILLAPTVAQMVNDALKPPPFPYGTAIGAALGAGPAAAMGAGRRIQAARQIQVIGQKRENPVYGRQFWRGFM